MHCCSLELQKNYTSRTSNINNICEQQKHHKRLWKISGRSMTTVLLSCTTTAPSTNQSDDRRHQHTDDVPMLNSDNNTRNDATAMGFVISQGLVADSDEAYWVEQHDDDHNNLPMDTNSVGDDDDDNDLKKTPTICSSVVSFWSYIIMSMTADSRHRIVVIHGTFDYGSHRFMGGTWTDSQGNSGLYPVSSKHLRHHHHQNRMRYNIMDNNGEDNHDVSDYNMHISYSQNGDIDEERDPSISKWSIRGGFSSF
jgi:hypothetical protein